MIGQLPVTLDVAGKRYKIRSDYRVVLRIMEAMSDPELTDKEKLLVCLVNIYPDFDSIPQNAIAEAYKQAVAFIENGSSESQQKGKVLDWTKDERLIFPAVNAAAGFEVRGVEYLHWWTFLGYFQSIDRDSLLGTVLTIRQKRRKRKKLEEWEQEFYTANKEMCDLTETGTAKSAQNALQEIYQQLIEEAKNGGGEE